MTNSPAWKPSVRGRGVHAVAQRRPLAGPEHGPDDRDAEQPATSREALSSAEAIPERSAGMAARMALVSGTFLRPAPAPNSRNPGIRSPNTAPRPSLVIRNSPTAMISMPPATVRAVPSRAVTGPARPENSAIARAIGTNASPASVGEKPRTFCR